MRFYDSQRIERVGFDFYCDIANRVEKARKEKGYTQKELSLKSGIKESRISNIECVKTRIDLDDLERLSKVLDVSVDWLIDAEMDWGGKECLYLVGTDTLPDFRIYFRATSKQMAFLKFDKMLKDAGVRYESPRARGLVELVGVPTTAEEIRSKFPRRTEDELPIEPDNVASQKD